MQCPDCGSSHCRSNKLQNVSVDHVSATAQAARQMGHSLVMYGTVALWAFISTANEFRRDWRCDSCGAKFNG